MLESVCDITLSTLTNIHPRQSVNKSFQLGLSVGIDAGIFLDAHSRPATDVLHLV
jgi:hypothetical protein